jgi:TonB family protein
LFSLVAALPLLFVSGSALAQPSDVTPPKLLEHGEVAYPPSEASTGTEVSVVLFVTVQRDGTVGDAAVAESGGPAFDRAAIDAVKGWRFEPASRAGAPIRARIRVPIQFAPRAPKLAPLPPEAPADTAPPAAPTAVAPASPVTPVKAVDASEVAEVTIAGHATTPSIGASDIRVRVGALAAVPRKNATELLTLAPGFLLTNEGGDGHAEQIFLRGFDAREGQDLELSVGGVPINESGNLHGNGYADTHFIIPELVDTVRVVEGPFDPRQGNYAVAGSADYELGLAKRGLTAKYTFGSFNSHRLLFLWGPPGGSPHTFGGVELASSDGFGQNRDSKHATAMGQYEGALGERGSFRITGAAYATSYHSAGVLRQDDVDSGKKGFYDTYDPLQGGDASRYSIAADLETRSGDIVYRQQLFAVYRTMNLRENFTGFLLDVQTPLQELHAQRGDLLELALSSFTVGARGSARLQGEAFGQRQDLELGYFARGDSVDASQTRIEAATGHPYHVDTSLGSRLADIGLYADAGLRPFSWITLRGGVRADLFAFDVLDDCAVQSVSHPSKTNPPGDASCLDQQDFGNHREPFQRASTASAAILPRTSVIIGPFGGFHFNISVGKGARSIDPSYITQDVKTPFAGILAYEGGVEYAGGGRDLEVVARSIVFQTRVDRDLVFSETAGRNVLGGGTTRTGWVGSVRVTGEHFDASANATLVKSTFDDTGLLVPYVPDAVIRADAAVFGDLPVTVSGSRLHGTVGAGASYVGHRPLPYGQRSDVLFTLDTSASLAWTHYELGLSVTNLLDRQYRLGEYNFASDFHTEASPTLVPVRHFSAGAPRAIFGTLAVNLGGS